MTNSEMRELDAYLAEHVMGCKLSPEAHISIGLGEFYIAKESGTVVIAYDGQKGWPDEFEPTTDPAAAMEVLKRCAEKCDGISIVHVKGEYVVAVSHGLGGWKGNTAGISPVLETAIALFAKQLFTLLGPKEDI